MMQRNTSVILGEHFSEFVASRIEAGRFESISEAARAGLHLLEEQETKLDFLRDTLAAGERDLDAGKGVDGDSFMEEVID